MLKKYNVKNIALREAIASKFFTRVEADATIGINCLVEKNATSGDIQPATLGSVRVIGANQGMLRDAGEMFDIETGLVNVVAGTALAAGQLAKAGTNGKAVGFVDAGVKGAVIGESLGAAFTNQPANDNVDVVSASALDTTQKVTIHGTAVSTGAYLTETLTLKGTTKVSTTAKFATVAGIEIDVACKGAITVSEKSASKTIVELAIGDLSAGIHYLEDGSAYNKKASIVASAASTADVLIAHKATDETEAIIPVTLTGDTAVTLSAASLVITKLMVGNVADTVTATLKVNASEDDLKAAIGKVVKGANAGDNAIILI